MKSPTDFSFVEIRESWRTIKNVRVFSTFVRRKAEASFFPGCRSVAHVARDASSTCPAVPCPHLALPGSHPLTSSSTTSTTLTDSF